MDYQQRDHMDNRGYYQQQRYIQPQRPSPHPFSNLPPLRSSESSYLAPSHSVLRYPARKDPSLSPKFDLSQYSMSQDKTVSPKAHSPRDTLPPFHSPPPPRPTIGRKREREEDTPSSASSSSVVTPRLDDSFRSTSTLESLLLNDEKPVGYDWDRREAKENHSSTPLTMQQPVTAFPLQFGYSSGAPPNAADRHLNVDPVLSSVRSSADAAGTPQPPEIRFTDETLHSAAGTPSAVLEAALHHAQKAGDDDSLDVPDDKKDQPFSRSPELRISHKLAERKRRKEMKELFDELREQLPAERGSKSSKWEILSKAIDHIIEIKGKQAEAVREIEKLKRELEMARSYAFPPGYQTAKPEAPVTANGPVVSASAAPAPAAETFPAESTV